MSRPQEPRPVALQGPRRPAAARRQGPARPGYRPASLHPCREPENPVQRSLNLFFARQVSAALPNCKAQTERQRTSWRRTCCPAFSQAGVAVERCDGSPSNAVTLLPCACRYAVAIALTTVTDDSITAVAWDSAGVTTGPVTVPFVLAIGIGFAKAVESGGLVSGAVGGGRSGAPAAVGSMPTPCCHVVTLPCSHATAPPHHPCLTAAEGFGMLTIMSVAPIISVLAFSHIRKPAKHARRRLSRAARSMGKTMRRTLPGGEARKLKYTQSTVQVRCRESLHGVLPRHALCTSHTLCGAPSAAAALALSSEHPHPSHAQAAFAMGAGSSLPTSPDVSFRPAERSGLPTIADDDGPPPMPQGGPGGSPGTQAEP